MIPPGEGKPLDGEAKRDQSSPEGHVPTAGSGAAGGQPWEMGAPGSLEPWFGAWILFIIPRAVSAFLDVGWKPNPQK